MFKNKDKDKNREIVYTEGIVVGYEDGGRYTGLTVRFHWNGTSVRCDTARVNRFDFPEGTKVNIYYYPDIMRRSRCSNDDYILGVIHINDPKYIKKNENFVRNLKIFLMVLAPFLTLLTIASFIVAISG
jgi:hypothetical protein